MKRGTWDRVTREFPEVSLDDIRSILETPLKAVATDSWMWSVVDHFENYHGRGECVLRLQIGFELGSTVGHLDDFVRFCTTDRSDLSTGVVNWELILAKWWEIQEALPEHLHDYEFPTRVPHDPKPAPPPKQFTVYEIDAKTNKIYAKGTLLVPSSLVGVANTLAAPSASDLTRIGIEKVTAMISFEYLKCIQQRLCASANSTAQDALWYWGDVVPTSSVRRNSAVSFRPPSTNWSDWRHDFKLEWSHGKRDLLEAESLTDSANLASQQPCVDSMTCVNVAASVLGRAERSLQNFTTTGYDAYIPTAIVFSMTGLGAYFELAERIEEFRYKDR